MSAFPRRASRLMRRCLPKKEVLRRFSLFADDCADGVDAFVFVIRWGRFTAEKAGGLEAFKRNAGEAALQRTVLCFTHCDAVSDLDFYEQLTDDKSPAVLRDEWRAAGAERMRLTRRRAFSTTSETDFLDERRDGPSRCGRGRDTPYLGCRGSRARSALTT